MPSAEGVKSAGQGRAPPGQGPSAATATFACCSAAQRLLYVFPSTPQTGAYSCVHRTIPVSLGSGSEVVGADTRNVPVAVGLVVG